VPELEAAEKRIAELEARGKPVMFIDGDISSADADKLAAVIREFNEETETPAARMARIIRENPYPTNMCDMPAAAGKGDAS
jgi:8-oxo-dGTP pyrophosphatase MutT (NUDIX family)